MGLMFMSSHSTHVLGKIAIVTGGASGLGLAIANMLVEAGAVVVVFDKDEGKLKQLPDTIQSVVVDVTDPMSLQHAVNNIVSLHARIDILVNNAGVIYNEPLINITKTERKHSYESFKRILDINLSSVFLMGSIVAEQMIIKRTKGTIINISSICSEGNAGQTAYSAAKAGVNALTKTWSKELGAFGIRVVGVSPGFINTPSTNASLDAGNIDALTKRISLRKLGAADDVAHAVLLAVQNPYINGSIIDVHGGLSL